MILPIESTSWTPSSDGSYIWELMPRFQFFNREFDLVFLIFFALMTVGYAYFLNRQGGYKPDRAIIGGVGLAFFITSARELIYLVFADYYFSCFALANRAAYVWHALPLFFGYHYIILSRKERCSFGKYTRATLIAILLLSTVVTFFLGFPDIRLDYTWKITGEVGAFGIHIVSKVLFLLLGAMPFYDKMSR